MRASLKYFSNSFSSIFYIFFSYFKFSFFIFPHFPESSPKSCLFYLFLLLHSTHLCIYLLSAISYLLYLTPTLNLYSEQTLGLHYFLWVVFPLGFTLNFISSSWKLSYVCVFHLFLFFFQYEFLSAYKQLYSFITYICHPLSYSLSHTYIHLYIGMCVYVCI